MLPSLLALSVQELSFTEITLNYFRAEVAFEIVAFVSVGVSSVFPHCFGESLASPN